MNKIDTTTKFEELAAVGSVRRHYDQLYQELETKGFLALDEITDTFYQCCRVRFNKDIARRTLNNGVKIIFIKSRYQLDNH